MESIMNRPLKFKVWNTKSNEWCGTIGLNETIPHNSISYLPDDLVFVQYTGLKDSKGKEIYEGDILNVWNGLFVNKIGQVVYEVDHGGYIFQYNTHMSSIYHINLNGYVVRESVKIGNIFEHSKLLKAKYDGDLMEYIIE